MSMCRQVTPEVLYCAKKAGVTHILKAGGAQAVAAMAWGTETCPKVPLPSYSGPNALSSIHVCKCRDLVCCNASLELQLTDAAQKS